MLEDGTWDVSLHSQPVTDLSSFKGAPISRLEIAFTKVSDLSPLAGAPLKILQIYNTPIADLTPLKGLPLEEIWMGETQVTDLTPLAGAPLKLFYADNNPQITNLDPLLESTNLERVMLPGNAQNLSALTKLPRLKYISFKYSSTSGRPAQTVEEFWLWHASYYTRFVEMSRVVEELRAACREYKWKSNPYDAVSVDLNGALRVDLHGSSIADLSPLRGKPVTSLNLNGTQVVDLEALRGMPLEFLECEGGLVRSLEPLQGLPLKYLQLGGCPVSDLTPLSGMPLERLYLGRNSENKGNDVSDLAPLKTLWQLKELALDGTQQPDVTPLAECRQLERIVLPETVLNLGSLRQLPNLKGLAWGFPGSWDKLSPAAEFLREYQEHLEAIRPVFEALNQGKSVPFDPRRIHREKDGQFMIDRGAISPECLVRLRGLPVRELHLNDLRQLRDLSPLAGMQTLEFLNLTHTIVTDLTPLRDLKLRRLELGYTPVSDLTPLRGQPLEVLAVDHCHELKDISLLAEFPTLTSLLISKEVGGVEALRKLPKLEFLSDEWSGSFEQPARPAAEFWAAWEKNKKLRQ